MSFQPWNSKIGLRRPGWLTCGVCVIERGSQTEIQVWVCLHVSVCAHVKANIKRRKHKYLCACMLLLSTYVLYACIYVCTHVCVYACMYARKHACTYACLHARMHVCIYVCMHVGVHVCMHVCMPAGMHACMYVYMAANQKHWPCNRLGRPFRDKGLLQTGVFCNKPLRDKPLEDYSTLHRGPRQGFVTEGPRQRFVTGGGPATFLFHSHMYACM